MSLSLDRCTALLGDPNVRAFLRVIREGESGQGDDAYTVMYGGEHFTAPPWKHPYHNIPTTQGGRAAGAYQFLGTTWARVATDLELDDFAPAAQDIGAVYLIDGRGAMAAVQNGDLVNACYKLRDEWVSLPSLGLERVRRTFESYGGKPISQTGAGATPAEPRPPTPTPLPQSPHSYDLPRLPTGGSMLAMLLTTLASGFAPLLQAKLNGALGKAVADPALGAQLTGQIMGAVQQVAGQFNPAALNDPVVAVATIRTNPAAQAQAEKVVSEKLDELLPLFDRLAQYQQAEWDNVEKAKGAAHERSSQIGREGPLYRNAAFIIGLIMLVMVFGVAGTVLWKDAIMLAAGAKDVAGYSPEIQSFVIGAIVGSGLTAVLGYFLGSSSGSSAKTALMAELATRPR